LICADPQKVLVIQMHPLKSTLACCGLLIVSLARADSFTFETSGQLAAGCANCHGTDGHARTGLPQLAGWPRTLMVERMQDYKNDRRKGTMMNQLAKGYEDAEIEALAQYFSQQKTLMREP
jgi:cytochrome subunit of sulfide dehydrogenase